MREVQEVRWLDSRASIDLRKSESSHLDPSEVGLAEGEGKSPAQVFCEIPLVASFNSLSLVSCGGFVFELCAGYPARRHALLNLLLVRNA